MRQSVLFPKTKKEPPKDSESINHKLLVRAGFIDQLMSGSWTLLPLGWRVVDRINNIVREELNKIGAQEILMPLLHPKSIWNETGRWETAKEVMYQFTDTRNKEFALSFTHEEIFLDLIRKHVDSYQDLPLALYHFSTKFRNEPRAKSGILRGREFMMKDLYSVHSTEEDFWNYYNKVKDAYSRIFERIGFDIKITEAGGGVFTDNLTNEFQVPASGGEDTIFYCENCDWAVNKEVFDPNAVKEPLNESAKQVCPNCGGQVIKSKSIEVGNIFPFGTSYSEKMGITFINENGEKKHLYLGSYGIGSTRVMGTWVEVSNDEKGIIWGEEIAPFDVHLVQLPGGNGEEVYNKLLENGIEVLLDDRDVSAGEKFSDADLIGIPFRVITSEKTAGKLEIKKRNEKDSKILSVDDLFNLIHNTG